MDPVSSIVLALALGAAAGLKPTAEQAVKEGYAALKTLLQRKYDKVNVDLLEQSPTSETRKAVVQEDLAQAGAGQDEEVLRTAQALLTTIERQTPEAMGVIGFRFEDLKVAQSALLEGITATGPGARGIDITKAEVQGNLTIRDVRAGDSAAEEGSSPKG